MGREIPSRRDLGGMNTESPSPPSRDFQRVALGEAEQREEQARTSSEFKGGTRAYVEFKKALSRLENLKEVYKNFHALLECDTTSFSIKQLLQHSMQLKEFQSSVLPIREFESEHGMDYREIQQSHVPDAISRVATSPRLYKNVELARSYITELKKEPGVTAVFESIKGLTARINRTLSTKLATKGEHIINTESKKKAPDTIDNIYEQFYKPPRTIKNKDSFPSLFGYNKENFFLVETRVKDPYTIEDHEARYKNYINPTEGIIICMDNFSESSKKLPMSDILFKQCQYAAQKIDKDSFTLRQVVHCNILHKETLHTMDLFNQTEKKIFEQTFRPGDDGFYGMSATPNGYAAIYAHGQHADFFHGEDTTLSSIVVVRDFNSFMVQNFSPKS